MINPLLSAKQLKELMTQSKDLVLIDTRSQLEYDLGHIPGAIVNHDIFTYVTSEELGGLEGFREKFIEIFGNAGVKKNSRVVFYEDAHDTGYGQSCRGYFILKYLGHENVFILNGGFKAWLNEGYELANRPYSVKPVKFKPNINKEWIATTEEMQKAVKEGNVKILDCRDKDEWIGRTSSPYDEEKVDKETLEIKVDEYCPRKGRIPGAVWIEWKKLMKDYLPDPMFLPTEEILKKCAEVGITQDSVVYVYCFKGSRASNTMLALQLAGIKNVKNYFESWNVWSRDFNLPIDDTSLNQ